MAREIKIKLFVDAHVFDGIHQGTVTYISGLYREIIRNDQIQLYVGSENYELARDILKSDNFIHIKYTSHSRFKRLAIDIPLALRRNDIDYAHFQYIVPLFKTAKYIVTIHDLLFLDFPEKFPLFYRVKNGLLFYLSAKQADILTTVSEYSKKSITKHYKISSDQITVTPNAVQIQGSQVKEVVLLREKKYILYVSRIEPRKNQAKLLQAWVELKLYERNIFIVFVGAVGLNDSIFNELVEKLTDEQKRFFLWLQHVPEAELNWLYTNCSLFVFPSQAEGFGIPPIEAAFHGAKVVCSNATAMSDFDFFNRLSFSPDNIEEMKNKIMQGITEESDVDIIRENIMKRYNWPIIADNFVSKLLFESNS